MISTTPTVEQAVRIVSLQGTFASGQRQLPPSVLATPGSFADTEKRTA
jgi:hypothetical protein